MAAPRTFYLGSQFQYVLEALQIKDRVLCESPWFGHERFVRLRRNIRSKPHFFGHQLDNLLFVFGPHQPVLSFNDCTEKANQRLAMPFCPGALGEETRGLVRAN